MNVRYEGPGGLLGLFITVRRARRATWRMLRAPFAAVFIVTAIILTFKDASWEDYYTPPEPDPWGIYSDEAPR